MLEMGRRSICGQSNQAILSSRSGGFFLLIGLLSDDTGQSPEFEPASVRTIFSKSSFSWADGHDSREGIFRGNLHGEKYELGKTTCIRVSSKLTMEEQAN
jgi:hypothetical protein